MTRTATCAIVIALGFGFARGNLSSLSAQETRQAPRFRVGVDAVRIDAVVTDRDGRTVADLTADDFEVRQDGKLQKVTFAEFVPVLAGPSPPAFSPARSSAEARVIFPPAPVKREDVQRTVAVVVDDLSLSFESLLSTQRALHAFVDRELRPTDLVALVRTGGAGGGLQPFTTDRRVLHAAIDGLRWNGASRNGVEAFVPLNSWTTFDNRTGMSDVNDFKIITALRNSISAAGTLGALNLVVRGARDLPGRKAIIFVSEGFVVHPDSRERYALDRVIDQATRAGVVIYSLDCRGLQSATLQAADNLKRPDPGEALEETVRAKAQERFEFNRDTQEGMAYLAEQTGGFAVLNTNDLPRGLGRITDDVRSYYVIGYVPTGGTFARKGEKPRLHKISINVRRQGLRVKTRKEFLGVSDPPDSTDPLTPAQQLVHAATSPFAATDIALRPTTLPGYSPEQGMFVRALLQIDARALTFVDSEGGKKTASADVLGMVFDQEGTEVAHLSTGFSVALTNDAAEEALRRRARVHAAHSDPAGGWLPGSIRGPRSALRRAGVGRRVRGGGRHGGRRVRVVGDCPSKRRRDRVAGRGRARSDCVDARAGRACVSAGHAAFVRVRDLQRDHFGSVHDDHLARHRQGVCGGARHAGASAWRRSSICRRGWRQTRPGAAARQLCAAGLGHDTRPETPGPEQNRGAANWLRRALGHGRTPSFCLCLSVFVRGAWRCTIAGA